uniref:Uncharacterized protein n=1 Tax=Sinocyclocheilus grahami TaxID=75366 RepID=A0A672MU53_SINGR
MYRFLFASPFDSWERLTDYLNFLYVVLCGGAFAGGLAYAYRTVSTDHARFVDRVSEINARPKSDWKPKAWPPKGKSHLWAG